MAAYDSDSSIDEDTASFTTTDVLLGYASKEATNDTISQLGGQPCFLDPEHPPSAALARCKTCNNLMSQLLQLHGDLPERFATHERRLHIWACRGKTCKRKTGSVRAIRSTRAPAPSTSKQSVNPESLSNAEAQLLQKQQQPEPDPAPKPDLGTSIFGTGKFFGAPPPSSVPPAAPSSTASPSPATQPDLSATFAAKARINSPTQQASPQIPHEPWPSTPPQAYPVYHLDADYESLDAPSVPTTTAQHIADLNDPTLTSGGATSASTKDDFESTLDKTFQRFADRLAQNPEQVLRYEFQGAPLLYSRSDEVGKMLGGSLTASSSKASSSLASSSLTSGSTLARVPRCARCGAARVFELQLVPHAIVELEAEDDSLEGMEWGTIILGVCGRDCAGQDGRVVNVEEWVGVQWEETTK